MYLILYITLFLTQIWLREAPVVVCYFIKVIDLVFSLKIPKKRDEMSFSVFHSTLFGGCDKTSVRLLIPLSGLCLLQKTKTSDNLSIRMLSSLSTKLFYLSLTEFQQRTICLDVETLIITIPQKWSFCRSSGQSLVFSW